MKYGHPLLTLFAAQFSPTDLPELTLWYDFSDTGTITAIGGDVTVVADKSGNGNDSTDSGAGNRPATGATTLNGLNVLDFSRATGEYLTLPNLSLTTDITMFFVVNPSDAVTNYGIIGDLSDLFNGYNIYLRNNQPNQDYAFGVTNAGTLRVGERTAVPQVIIARQDSKVSNDLSLYRNTTLLGSGTSAGSFQNLTTPIIGFGGSGIGGLNGFIGEVIIYNQTLNSSEIQQVANYLVNKWGIN